MFNEMLAAARLSSTNYFPTNITFNKLTFSGNNYFLNGSIVGLNAGVFGNSAATSISLNMAIRLNADQTFSNAVSTSLSFNFTTNFIDLKGRTLTLDGAGTIDPGLLIGSGGIIRQGTGLSTLTRSNTYLGP